MVRAISWYQVISTADLLSAGPLSCRQYFWSPSPCLGLALAPTICICLCLHPSCLSPPVYKRQTYTIIQNINSYKSLQSITKSATIQLHVHPNQQISTHSSRAKQPTEWRKKWETTKEMDSCLPSPVDITMSMLYTSFSSNSNSSTSSTRQACVIQVEHTLKQIRCKYYMSAHMTHLTSSL